MEHTNTLRGQNAENLYIETGGTLDIKGLNSRELPWLRQGTDREPRGSGMSDVGNRYQETREAIAGWEELSVCSSKL
jgi:hypothetical protein